MAKPIKLHLILEKQDEKLWGRVEFNDNLMIDSASSIPALEKKIRKALLDFEGIREVEFEYRYDLTVFFEQFSFLNQSKIAELAGINPGLIRQYSSGHKQPSREQVDKIEKAIREMAGKLRTVKLSAKAQA